MPTNDLYYKLSGRYRTGGVILAAVVLLIAAAILGLVYGILERYNPLVYFTFLGTIFVGVGLGFVVGFMAQAGHVRNRFIIAGLALFAGVMVEYFATMGWIMAMANWEGIVISPISMVQVMAAISEEGAWSIKGSVVSGLPLILIWLIEAAILIGAPVYFAWNGSADMAYCEDCRAWLDDPAPFGPFTAIEDPKGLRSALEAGEFNRLAELTPVAGGTETFATLLLRGCAGCHNLHLLDIKNTVVKKDAKGNAENSDTPVISHMLLDRESHDLLRDLAAAPVAPPVDPAKPGDDDIPEAPVSNS